MSVSEGEASDLYFEIEFDHGSVGGCLISLLISGVVSRFLLHFLYYYSMK